MYKTSDYEVINFVLTATSEGRASTVQVLHTIYSESFNTSSTAARKRQDYALEAEK